jgi:hypothetical protein
MLSVTSSTTTPSTSYDRIHTRAELNGTSTTSTSRTPVGITIYNSTLTLHKFIESNTIIKKKMIYK